MKDVTVLKPRKPKRLKTPSDKLSKRQLIAKLTRIEKFQARAAEKKYTTTYPPELLPVPNLGDDVSIIVSCNRPDCIGEECPFCGVIIS